MLESHPIVENIMTLINEDLGLYFLCQAIKAYDTKNLPIPLDTTYFAVSCKENKNIYYENDEAQQCMKNTVTVRLNCYAPLWRIPYMSHGLCEIAVKFVCDNFMPYVKSAQVGDTEYDSEVKAFRVPCSIVLEYLSCPGENTQSSELAEASNYFCKSHISDTDIHLSEGDRAFLNAPCVINEYTGNGADGFQNITLGFKPSTVIVYKNGSHPTICNFTTKFTCCYFGIATGSSYSKALTTTANGFRVRNTVGSEAGTYLNEADVSYTYIAFK